MTKRVIHGPLMLMEPYTIPVDLEDSEEPIMVQGDAYDPNAITLEEIQQAEAWAAELYRRRGKVPRCDLEMGPARSRGQR